MQKVGNKVGTKVETRSDGRRLTRPQPPQLWLQQAGGKGSFFHSVLLESVAIYTTIAGGYCISTIAAGTSSVVVVFVKCVSVFVCECVCEAINLGAAAQVDTCVALSPDVGGE